MALRLSTGFDGADDRGIDIDERKADLSEHLAELRTRIIRACLYAVAGMAVTWLFFSPIYQILVSPIESALKHNPRAGELVITNFADAFLLKIQISAFGGLLLAVPFAGLELWGFVAPGLTRAERHGVRLVAPFTILLFVTGVICAFLVMPLAVRWFLSYLADIPGAVLLQNPLIFIVFSMKMMLAFGLVFQLPVVLVFLGKVGLITSDAMIRYWRQITVGLFTGAMIVAPSNDPATMLVLAIPLTLLFLLSISFVKMVEPKGQSKLGNSE
ncbi:MAG: twin-arginine translocase subunit TatC [Capsulimonadaceae bacterium]